MFAANSIALALKGGFGNQLFEYAAALSVQDCLPNSHINFFSTGNEWGKEHPDINSTLGIEVRYPNRAARMQYRGVSAREGWQDDFSALSAQLISWAVRRDYMVLTTPFDPFVDPKSSSVFMEGFFQHPSWWSNTWSRVAHFLVEARDRQINDSFEVLPEVTAIKVRRSDYLRLGWALDLQYFEDAFERLEVAGSPVMLFTEDEGFVREFTKFCARFNCAIVPSQSFTGNPNIDDFWNLSLARKQVLSNSSYSWWAGAMATLISEDTKIAYPRPWFPESPEMQNVPDMGLPGWHACGASFVHG